MVTLKQVLALISYFILALFVADDLSVMVESLMEVSSHPCHEAQEAADSKAGGDQIMCCSSAQACSDACPECITPALLPDSSFDIKIAAVQPRSSKAPLHIDQLQSELLQVPIF